MSTKSLLLANGKSMPMVGLGTWRSPPDVLTQAVKDAIDIGYRHLDCAHIYRNEEEVGMAIEAKVKEGVLKRDELFVTSKLWNTHHKPELVRHACEVSLQHLRLDYLDLYLLHWPTAFKSGDDLYPIDPVTGKTIFEDIDYIDTWHAMEPLVDEGLCRAIGVCNLNVHQLKRLLNVARIKPVVLQVECHPYLRQQELIEVCREQGIVFTAYSSLGSGHTPYEKPGAYPLLQHPIILQLAKKYKCEPAQLILRYQTQLGIIVIPRSITKAHIAANFNIWDFELETEDLKAIDALDCNGRINVMAMGYGHPHHPFEPAHK